MKEGAGRDPFADHLAALPLCMGEILIRRAETVEFDLRHRDDAGRADLAARSDPEAAADLAHYDDAGKYRPLKTAPNLRHGWQLLLRDAVEVRRALDSFYPGRVAAFVAHVRGILAATTLRETLERQSGMYRVAAAITMEQADDLVGRFCSSSGSCLRTIRWNYDASGAPASSLLPAAKFDPAHDQTGRGESTIPLLCQEACCLLVAEARNIVKAAPA